ncbi:hypothetical protein [Chitinilyticum litopenaei]|uniref:hypothetical protein n=1 Tax=Chitinilyticum litopenaei TaxID=1121276 RepID=UPI000404763E|nr:hypothetical protein [Chitinilyticum litopenaei]
MRLKNVLGATLAALLLCGVPALLPAKGLAQQASADVPELAAQGKRIGKLLNERDRMALLAMIDMPALAERVTAGIQLGAKDKADFVRGFTSPEAGRRMVDTSMNLLELNHGIAYLVKSRPLGKGSIQTLRIDFRSADDEHGGYEYIDYYVNEQGRVFDWYLHSRSALISKTMSRLLLSMVEPDQLGTLLFNRKTLELGALQAMQDMGRALNAGKFDAAYAAMQKLPAEFRDSVEGATTMAALATQLDESRHRQSLARLARLHGDKASVQFMLIDHYFYQKDYPRMLAAIAAFEQRVVEDGATNYLRCTAQLEAGQLEAARKACERSVALEPTVKNGWYGLMTVESTNKDAARLLKVLTRYEQQFAMEFDPDKLVEQDFYAWLAGKPEFRAWAAKRR